MKKRIATNVLHQKRTRAEKIADFLTDSFGTMAFLIINASFFWVWMALNSGVFATSIFDPYPFNFLTMIVSLEAIFLSIIVLISQNRAARLADLREEIDFQVNVQAEREITKILKILAALEKKMHIHPSSDPELRSMVRDVDITELAKRIAEDIRKAT